MFPEEIEKEKEMRNTGIWRESQKMWNDIRKNNNNSLLQNSEQIIHNKNKSFYIK